MDAALDAAVARGRAAWPRLAAPGFSDAVRAAVADAADPEAAIADLAVEDLYLAQACTTGDRDALAAFGEHCDPAMTSALRSMGIAAEQIEEILQEVRLKLFTPPARIATYTGRASLATWTRTVATRAAIDRLRSSRAAEPAEADEVDRFADPADSPELAHFRQMYLAEFKAAFEVALASLEVRDRNVLRHHFVDGLTTDDIGALYDVHKTTAFRWLDSARDKLSKRTRHELVQRIQVPPDELDGILRLVQSQIDLSLSRVL